MFNTKRIIFLISLLSIVALTGALMAGPAFAGKGGNGNGNGNAGDASHRTVICHYQGYESALFELNEVSGLMEEVKAEEVEKWMAKTVDADSVDSHMANHGIDDVTDFVILFEGEGELEGQEGTYDSAADCTTLQNAL